MNAPQATCAVGTCDRPAVPGPRSTAPTECANCTRCARRHGSYDAPRERLIDRTCMHCSAVETGRAVGKFVCSGQGRACCRLREEAPVPALRRALRRDQGEAGLRRLPSDLGPDKGAQMRTCVDCSKAFATANNSTRCACCANGRRPASRCPICGEAKGPPSGEVRPVQIAGARCPCASTTPDTSRSRTRVAATHLSTAWRWNAPRPPTRATRERAPRQRRQDRQPHREPRAVVEVAARRPTRRGQGRLGPRDPRPVLSPNGADFVQRRDSGGSMTVDEVLDIPLNPPDDWLTPPASMVAAAKEGKGDAVVVRGERPPASGTSASGTPCFATAPATRGRCRARSTSPAACRATSSRRLART